MKKLEKDVEMILTGDMENRFGMKQLESAKKVPIESLKFNRDYQRATEHARKENAKKGMIACGQFLPDKPLTVNQDNEIVDGQHRYLAAKELGHKTVPVVRYFFASKQKEAEFFIFINNFDQRLKSADYWYANFLAKDPVALFLYELNTSENSTLRNNIALKGSETQTKWTVFSALSCIVYACGGENHWVKTAHGALVTKLDSVGTKTALFKINRFVDWYNEIFGHKTEKPWAHRKDVFEAIKFLYIQLEKIGATHNKDTINKMKSFLIDSAYISAPLIGKKMHLVNHYNKNRKKNLLSWEIQ